MKILTIEPTAKNYTVTIQDGADQFIYLVEATGKGQTWFVTRSRRLFFDAELNFTKLMQHRKEVTRSVLEKINQEIK